MTDKQDKSTPDVTVADQHRVARRPDGSTYLVNVSGAKDQPEGTVTALLDDADVLLPPTVTP